jgi:hypothetical protein
VIKIKLSDENISQKAGVSLRYGWQAGGMNDLDHFAHLCLMNLEACVAVQKLVPVLLASDVIFAIAEDASFTAECQQVLGLQRAKENHH